MFHFSIQVGFENHLDYVLTCEVPGNIQFANVLDELVSVTDEDRYTDSKLMMMLRNYLVISPFSKSAKCEKRLSVILGSLGTIIDIYAYIYTYGMCTVNRTQIVQN